MEKISIKAYAKINLKLDINGVFEDGYHSLDMLMASCDIYDEIIAQKSNKNSVYMDGLLQDDKNTAKKAIDLLSQAYGYHLDIKIKKHIPLSAGVGGSSADAAGVFYCYSRLYGIELDSMKKLALLIGADVVYMLEGGAKKVKGKGEIVINANYIPLSFVIAQKEYGGLTKDVYKKYDDINSKKDNVLDYKGIKIFNVLEDAAISICPSIKDTILDLKKYTDYVFMTGSGSAVIGIFDNEIKAKKCLDNLKGYLYKNISKTIPFGIEEI